MSQPVILFDINETVLNLNMLKPKFKQYLGDECYMNTWFYMLLHASTVCLATDVKTNFKSLALSSLKSLATRLDTPLADDALSDILNTLASLPAHNDIKPALTKLRAAGFTLIAFSNSSSNLLASQLTHAGLSDYFDDAISVESIGTFKPSKSAYQYAVDKLNMPADNIRLVAAHDWDTHGALSAGLNAAFIDRFGAQYNALYKKPDITASTMDCLTEKIIKKSIL